MSDFVAKYRFHFISAVCFFMVAALGFADVATGEILDFSVFYFFPIVISAWFIGLKFSLYVAMLSLSVWMYAEWSGGLKYQLIDNFIANIIFVANAILVATNYLAILFLIIFLKREIKLSSERKLLREKAQTVIKLSQNICGLFGQYITRHNSEILKWINIREKNGQQVSDKVKISSLAIGRGAQTLSQVSFDIHIYDKNLDVDRFLRDLEARLELVEEQNKKRDP